MAEEEARALELRGEIYSLKETVSHLKLNKVNVLADKNSQIGAIKNNLKALMKQRDELLEIKMPFNVELQVDIKIIYICFVVGLVLNLI